MRNLITVFLCIAVGVLTATISNSLLYQAPDECRWFGSANDITLVCRLRTINSELENTNFSVIQPQNTIRLRLECNDALLFQSSINPGSFRPLYELRSLTINYCKIGNLTDGSFQGLRELRNLTIQTHNTDWSPMSLEISPNVFTGTFVENIYFAFIRDTCYTADMLLNLCPFLSSADYSFFMGSDPYTK